MQDADQCHAMCPGTDAECSCKSSNMSVAGLGNRYNGDITPLTSTERGTALNASGSDPASEWTEDDWNSERVWNPDEPWDTNEPWDSNDPWDGYRADHNGDLVTETRPLAKLPADEDPDTVLNRRGAYVPKPAEAAPPKTAAAETSQKGETAKTASVPTRVRRVGPKYFVAQ